MQHIVGFVLYLTQCPT